LLLLFVIGFAVADRLPRSWGQGAAETIHGRVRLLEERVAQIEGRLARLESREGAPPVEGGGAAPSTGQELLGERLFVKDGVTVELTGAAHQWPGILVNGRVSLREGARPVTIHVEGRDAQGRQLDLRAVEVYATRDPTPFRVRLPVDGVARVRVADVR
jgi:hypothetical protein